MCSACVNVCMCACMHACMCTCVHVCFDCRHFYMFVPQIMRRAQTKAETLLPAALKHFLVQMMAPGFSWGWVGFGRVGLGWALASLIFYMARVASCSFYVSLRAGNNNCNMVLTPQGKSCNCNCKECIRWAQLEKISFVANTSTPQKLTC